jgi:hypothetical protein
LERLNPDFYPQRALIGPEDTYSASAMPVFPKDELLHLYSLCHPRLHRGNVSNIMEPRDPMDKSFPIIRMWLQKIIDLLPQHFILLDRNPGLAIFCHMGRIDASHEVAVEIIKWPE